MEKSGVTQAAETTKQGILTGSQQLSDYSKRNWEPIQKTLDDKGVTDAMTKTGAQLSTGYKYAADSTIQGLGVLNSAVDQNATLKSAKDSTAKGLSYMSSSMTSFFGWTSKSKKAPA